jgi:hypothetical protein
VDIAASGLLVAALALGSWQIQQVLSSRQKRKERRTEMRVSVERLLIVSDLANNQSLRERMESLVKMIREDDFRDTCHFRTFLDWWAGGGRRSLADDSKFPAVTSDLRKLLEQMLQCLKSY